MTNPTTTNKEISFKGDDNSYLCPSWGDMNAIAFKIAKQIQKKKLKFDRVITLAKGGWPLTRSLVDFLQIDKIASIGVKFYQGVNNRFEKPYIYQEIPVTVKNKKILLFDDVADTGGSLEFVSKHLIEKGVNKITTATLYYKPHSTIKPDFYGGETSAWISFPYETVEMIIMLGKKWKKMGCNKREIEKRFLKLNFKKEWVDYYSNSIT